MVKKKGELTLREIRILGGKARMNSLTPKQRSELASNAGKARWAKTKK